MGQGESRREENLRINKIDPNQWKIYKSDGTTQHATDSQGREAQISLLKLDPNRKIDDQMEVYTFRRKVERPLVKCYGAEPLNKSDGGICGAGHMMKVITQRVVKRWIQLPQLTFPQILHALQQCLKGYYTLFKQAGPFQINPNMIGINKLGQLLIWLNKNFADNNPSQERGILYATGQDGKLNEIQSQNQMVRNILNVIEQRCQSGKYPSDFKKLTESMISQKLDFKDALNTIRNYITVKNIGIVDKIHPDSKKMYTLSGTKVQELLFTPQKKSQDISSLYVPKRDQVYQSNYINKISGRAEPSVVPKNPIVQQKFEANNGFILGTPKQLTKPTTNYVVQERFTNDFRKNPNINTTDSVLYQGSPLNTKPMSPMVVNKTPTITQTITSPTPVTFTNPSLLAGLPTKNITFTQGEVNKPPSIINSYNKTTNLTGATNFSSGYVKGNQFGGSLKTNQFGITPITFTTSGNKITNNNYTTFETKKLKKDGVVTFGYETKPQGSQIQTSQVTRQF